MGLTWKKGVEEVSEALVDDEVILFCEVENIDDGEHVKITIYEHDDDEDHDFIKDLTGEVKNGKIEIPWQVEYHADDDDSNSAEEIENYGYTLPEYFFIMEYNSVKSDRSSLLLTFGKIDITVRNERSNKILQNIEYTIYYADGTSKQGKTDENGKIFEDRTYI